MYKTLVRDDSCFTEVEQINELGVLAADISEILAYLGGFDYKWD